MSANNTVTMHFRGQQQAFNESAMTESMNLTSQNLYNDAFLSASKHMHNNLILREINIAIVYYSIPLLQSNSDAVGPPA